MGDSTCRLRPKAQFRHVDILRDTYASCRLAIHLDRPHPSEQLGDSAGVIKHFYKRAIFRQSAETFWKLAPFLQPAKIPAFDLGEPRCSFAVSVAFDYPHFAKQG